MIFRPSARLLRRWTQDCDSKLLQIYEKYGPAWGLIASQFPDHRTSSECRKRWLNISGTLEAERFEADRQLWIDGYERITLSSGQCGWIKVPDVEKLPETPFERICKHLPKFRSNWLKKKAGWSEIELLALREGYEQLILPLQNSQNENETDKSEEIDKTWNAIAKKFSRRTGAQCRNFFSKQHIFWQSERKLNEVVAEINKTETQPELQVRKQQEQ